MTKRVRFSGFTLIELLIVIGLLAALASVLLPSLMGSRDDALEGVCNYNQAGSLRTLRQFEAMTGGYLPTGFHTGLDDTGNALMTGFPPAWLDAYGTTDNTGGIKALTPGEAASLAALGIGQLAYGTGDPENADPAVAMGYQNVASGSNVIVVGEQWKDDGGRLFTFNGKGIKAYTNETYSKVIALFLTPTVDWSKSDSVSWVKGFSVKMEIPGKCPVPVDADFAYYVVYVGVQEEGVDVKYAQATSAAGGTLPSGLPEHAEDQSDAETVIDAAMTSAGTDWSYSSGTITYTSSPNTSTWTVTFPSAAGKAALLGTSCPECGITNP
jgi:prepilin-type N-terminal cleavage/methylation domain-containing protein